MKCYALMYTAGFQITAIDMPRKFQLGKRHKYDWRKNAKLTIEHVALPAVPINKESLEALFVSIPIDIVQTMEASSLATLQMRVSGILLPCGKFQATAIK